MVRLYVKTNRLSLPLCEDHDPSSTTPVVGTVESIEPPIPTVV